MKQVYDQLSTHRAVGYEDYVDALKRKSALSQEFKEQENIANANALARVARMGLLKKSNDNEVINATHTNKKHKGVNDHNNDKSKGDNNKSGSSTKNNSSTSKHCNHCDRSGHLESSCWKKLKCPKCKQTGNCTHFRCNTLGEMINASTESKSDDNDDSNITISGAFAKNHQKPNKKK